MMYFVGLPFLKPKDLNFSFAFVISFMSFSPIPKLVACCLHSDNFPSFFQAGQLLAMVDKIPRLDLSFN